MKRLIPLMLLAAFLGLAGCDKLKELVGSVYPTTPAQSYVAAETALASVYTGFYQYVALPACGDGVADPCKDQAVVDNFITGATAANTAMDGWRDALRCPAAEPDCTPDATALEVAKRAGVKAVCELKPLASGLGATTVDAVFLFCPE